MSSEKLSKNGPGALQGEGMDKLLKRNLSFLVVILKESLRHSGSILKVLYWNLDQRVSTQRVFVKVKVQWVYAG